MIDPEEFVKLYRKDGLQKAMEFLKAEEEKDPSIKETSDFAWAVHFVADWSTKEGLYEQALKHYMECFYLFYRSKDFEGLKHNLEELGEWLKKLPKEGQG